MDRFGYMKTENRHVTQTSVNGQLTNDKLDKLLTVDIKTRC